MAEPDLLDVLDAALYFDEPSAPGVDALLAEAARHYGEPEAEQSLLRAYFLAPEQLGVLVGLYRYYFYQHRLEDALIVAERALEASARRLELAGGWRRLNAVQLGEAAMRSIGLLRFHLLALKAAAVVQMRLGRLADARARLAKVLEMDQRDQLGARGLLTLLDARIAAGAGEIAEETDHEHCQPV